MMLQTCARLIALAGPTVALLLLPLARFTEAAPGSPFQTTAPTAAPAANPKHDVPTGEYSVSPQTGAAGYGISIFTPPGRNGLVPQLGFGYSSQNPLRGGLAMGWSFDVPSIRVSTEDGLLGARRYVSSLAGNQRLVPVDEPNAGSDVAESFRAHHDDSWTRYERIDDGTPEGQWRARTIDGRTYYFGETSASRDQDPAGEGRAYRWMVTRVVDPFGNEIRYAYDKVAGHAHNGTEPLDVDIALRSVEYGGNPKAGLPHHVRIDFVYAPKETCPGSDVPIGARFHFGGGLRIYEGARRLVRVETHVGQKGAPGLSNNGSPMAAPDVRRITWFDYDQDELACQGAHAPLRVLEGVHVSGKSLDGRQDELPAQRFEYSRFDVEHAPAPSTFAFPTQGGVTSAGVRDDVRANARTAALLDRMWIDLDGDGLLDELSSAEIVEVAPPAAEIQTPTQTRCAFSWRRNLGGGQLGPPVLRPLPTMPWASGAGEHLGMRSDDSGNYRNHESCSLASQLTRRESGIGIIPEAQQCKAPAANYLNYRFVDINGDNRPELVTAMSYRPGVYDPGADPAVSAVLGQPPSTDGAPMCESELGEPAPCIWDVTQQITYNKKADDEEDEDPCPDGGCPGEMGCSIDYCVCGNPEYDSPECGADAFWETMDAPLDEQTEERPAGPRRGGKWSCFLQPESAGKVGGGQIGWPTHYVWRIYTNLGDGQFASKPMVRLSPVPLEDMALSSRLGTGLLASAGSWHAMVDIDGDGYDDVLWQYPDRSYFWYSDEPPGFFVFRGDRHGRFHGDASGRPIYWQTPMVNGRLRIHASSQKILDTEAALCEKTSTVLWEKRPDWCRQVASDTYTTLRDFNGDGLPDLWHKGAGEPIRVYFNTGRGFETTGTVISTELESFARTVRTPLSQQHASFPENGWSRSTHRAVDTDADGLADVVELAEPQNHQMNPLHAGVAKPVRAHINVGDTLVPVGEPAHMQPWFAGLAQISITREDAWETITDFGDFDNDGVPDNLGGTLDSSACEPYEGNGAIQHACGADARASTLPADGAGMRLLRTIHTGRGATVTFDYAPASRVVEQDPATSSRSTAPLWVTTKMTVAPAAGGAALEVGADVIAFPVMTTSYVYRYPVTTGTGADQARIHYRFRGFREVETHAPRMPGEPGIITEAHYDYGLDKTGRQVAQITRDTDGKVYQVGETDYLRRSMFGGRVLTYHISSTRTWTCEGASSVDDCKAAGLVVRTKNQWKALDGSDPLMAPDLPAKDHAPSSDQPDVVKSPIPIADPLPQKGTIVKKGFVAVADLAATTALGENVALSPGTKLSPGKTETVFEKAKDTVDGDSGSGGSGMEDYQADGEGLDDQKTTTDPWDETPGALVYYLASQTVQDHLGPIAPGDRVSVHRRQLISRGDAHILLETGAARYEALAGAALDDWDGWNLLARSASVYDEDALYLEAQYEWHTDKKVAKTAFDVDPDTGRVMAVTRPRHAGTAKKVVHEPGQLELVTWSTKSELGHRTYAVADLATGQPLVETGVPQASGIPGVIYQYDGFGRPTRVSRALFASAKDVAARAPSWQVAVTLTRYDDRASEVKTCTLIDEAPETGASSSCSLAGADGTALWKQESIRADGAGRPAYAIAETDRGPAVTRFHYDAAGRLDRATAPSPRGDTEPDEQVSFDYDVLGRPTRVDMPASADVITEYELGRVTQIRTRDDGEEVRKTQVNDAFGRMVRVIEYRGVADANGVHTEYSYDGNDNVASIARAADGIREDVASLRHDLAGNRIRLERDGQCWLFNYDRHGNLVSSAQPAVDGCPDGIDGAPPAYVATTIYDDIDRPVSSKPATRGMVAAEIERLGIGHETLIYDDVTKNAVGRLARTERVGLGAVEVEYDVFGQPVAEHRALQITPRLGVSVAIDATVRTHYNAAGLPERVEHADDPSAPTITRYEYDRTGAPVAVYAERTGADDLLLARFERNLAGLVEARLSDVDAGQTWAYDGEGRVSRTEVTGISPAGSIGACTGSCVIAGQALSFDKVGNVKSLTDLATEVAFAYTYDARDQLLTATTSDGGLTYDGAFSYDAFGRLATARVSSQLEGAGLWNRDVEYDYQPIAGTDGTPDRADPDAVRRLIDRNTGSVRASFAYDRWGSLRAKTRETDSYSFVTDSSNQLVEAEHAGDRETYYYLGAQRILAYRDAVGAEPARARHWFGATETWHAPDGATVKRRVDIALAGSYVARIEDAEPGDPDLVFTGILGSILATVDANGQATARFGYGPYGEVLYADGPDAADMSKRFNGKELDELTDLAYYGYRYYDRDTLSWTAADPFFRYLPDAAWTDPRRGNLYAFSLNNPVRWVDPDGRDPNGDNGCVEEPEEKETRETLGALVKKTTEEIERKRREHEKAQARAAAKQLKGKKPWYDEAYDSLPWYARWDAHMRPISETVYDATAWPRRQLGKAVGAAGGLVVWFGAVLGVGGGSSAAVAVDAATIRFTQDSIGRVFKDGGTLQEAIDGLRSGKIAPDAFPAIRVFERDGLMFTLDNRRLFVYQQAGLPIRVVPATAEEVAAEAWKFTTKNSGVSIKVRGGL